MKTIIRIYIVPTVIALVIYFSLTAINTKDLNTHYSNNSLRDSSETPRDSNSVEEVTSDPTNYNPNDLSSAFNESGYMKSNSVSMDGKEMINDFNGNLIYQIPMGKGIGEGDLTFDVNLTYNGNVNYQICTSTIPSALQQGGNLRSYNISAPGWIYSLNGFAVQMLNFETGFFTNPKGKTVNTITTYDVSGSDVHMLATGYQLTDNMNFYNYSHPEPDNISIMLGDGSTQSLINTNNSFNPGSHTYYTGWYRSPDKESKIKAYVEFMNYHDGESINPSEANDYAGFPRRMYLMKGDGLQYIFEEVPIKYNDLNNSAITNLRSQFWQNIFVLKTIKDRFGHVSNIDYNQPDGVLGRPTVAYLPGGFHFRYDGIWNNYVRVVVESPDGNYVFHTETWGDAIDANHRPRLNDYYNPSGETVSFGYDLYNRTGLHMWGIPANPTNLTEKEFTLKLSTFGTSPSSRLNLIYEGKNNAKYLKRKYEYIGASTNIDMNYSTVGTAGTPVTAHSSSYFGQGRDLFYSNMLSTATVEKSGVNLRQESFSYNYESHSRGDNNILEQPIDFNDDYTTTRSLNAFSNSENLNNTPSSKSSTKYYKNFRVKEKILDATISYEGSIKLEKEEISDATGLFKTTTNLYYGEPSTGQTQIVVPGTILLKSSEENFNEKKRKSQFEYTFESELPDANLTSKTEIDPLGKKTVTNFSNIFLSSFLVFKNGYYLDSLFWYNVFDSTRIYINNIPLSVETFTLNPSTNTYSRVQFKNMYYIGVGPNHPVQEVTDLNLSHIADGYPGELVSEQENNASSGSMLKEITYRYYNKDTIGMYMNPQNNLHTGSNNEGRLREITDPMGKKTKYYYNLINRSEEENRPICSNITDEFPCAPAFSYHKIYDNGVDSLQKGNWRSLTNLPARIDRYVDNNKFLTTYQLYNRNGNPMGIVNENNYLTEAEYDKYYRLASLSLPYDFNDTLASFQTIITPHTQSVEVISKSMLWGELNAIDNSWYLIPSNENTLPENYTYIGIDKHTTNNITDDVLAASTPLLKFYDNGFDHISNIDSAFLEFSPYYTRALDNNVMQSNGYYLIIRPLQKIFDYGSSNRNYVFGTGYSSFANLNISPYTECFGGENIYKKYDSSKVKLNITSMLNSNISDGKLDIQGLNFDMSPRLDFSGSDTKLQMYFYSCLQTSNSGISFNDYYARYSPKLRIYATLTTYDTTVVATYKNGTLIYNYDDLHDSVQVLNKMYKAAGKNVHKRVTHSFDELGRLAKTIQYKDYNGDTNVFRTGYNYLDQKARSTDAKYNVTNFSNDKYGNLSETDNADASSSFVNSSYQSSLTTAFYTLSNSFINKQEFIDETQRHYFKYFDAAGRLIRETKFVNEEIPDTDPYNPDSVYSESYTLPSDLALNTDYRYDSLYRVNCVQTPAYKRIWYNYDNLGRQIKRITPDAGITEYGYDLNNNLLTSQDAKQRAIGSDMYTYRSYDGLNRLLTISESQTSILPSFADAINSNNVLDFTASNNDLLTVNAYDELVQNSSNPFYDIFSNSPSDYYSIGNNSKGALVCTAFRTRKTDDWNYKYYRYDARGRVIVQWSYLDELRWKRENYTYNSQNQITSTQYQPNAGDAKSFANSYDLLGRLNGVSTYSGSNPIGQDDQNSSPQSFEGLAGYTYNPNSQILTSSLKSGMPVTNYSYTQRNWVNLLESSNSNSTFFSEGMNYNTNGNINTAYYNGIYKDNFSQPDEIAYHYVYDKSNRLLLADAVQKGVDEHNFDLFNTYDHDGNIIKLLRYEDDKGPSDNFNYSYQTGTNKLLKVRGLSTNDYSYDENGNLLKDDVNDVWDMKYDFRNLLLECTGKNTDIQNPANGDKIYHTVYNYDEAGNRISKLIWKYNSDDPHPTFPAGSWPYEKTEFYVRNISGVEVATYNAAQAVQFWNIWGSDNVGRIKGNGDKEFYIKDHLGSIRCVVDESSNILSSQDFDAWGHKINGRSYKSDKPSKYQFTSKERDIESDYDYFGARYYDSRIGRWSGVEPFLDKYLDFTPYSYVLNNPTHNIDIHGLDVYFYGTNGDPVTEEERKVIEHYLNLTSGKLKYSVDANGKLSVTGEAESDQENLIKKMVSDPDVITGLLFIDGQAVGGTPIGVGLYYGSEVKQDGKVWTYQAINLENAKVWEKGGGSSVGLSIIHETTESYLGGKMFPNQGQGYIESNYLAAHIKAVSYENPPQEYFRVDFNYKTTFIGSQKVIEHVKTSFMGKDNKEYIMYEKK